MTHVKNMQLAQVASPAMCFGAMESIFHPSHAQALSNLNSYLSSWQMNDGIGGIISTWWSSTVDTIEPHPMNQAPLMLGAARLISAGISGDWHGMIEREALGIQKQIRDDGLLRNGWGDMPGHPLAPVIGFSAAGGLYAAAAATQRDDIRHAADRIKLGYEEAFSDGTKLYHGVANQAARWAITTLQRYLLLGDNDDLEMAVRIGDTVLNEQIEEGQNTGAIYQGSNSDILISVYVGKCLYALLALYQVSGEARFLKAARSLGRYLISPQVQKDGLFINALEPAGSAYKGAKKASAVLRRIGVSYSLSAKLRRSTLTRWVPNLYPIAIARASDSLRGLCALSAYDEEIKASVQPILATLLDFQMIHGGFPNTIGYAGDLEQPPVWQDVTCPTRWNVYVFQLLSELVAGGMPDAELPMAMVIWPDPVSVRVGHNGMGGINSLASLIEDATTVELRQSNGGDLLWRVDKMTGATQATHGWYGELTAARSLWQLEKERQG